MTTLNEDEQRAFNFAIQLYTQLLFDHKELITGIIETAYSQGIKQGVAYAQQQIIASQQEQPGAENVEESSDVDPLPEPTRHTAPVRAPEKFSDKLKGVKR